MKNKLEEYLKTFLLMIGITIVILWLTSCTSIKNFGGVNDLVFDNSTPGAIKNMESICRRAGVIVLEWEPREPNFKINVVGREIVNYCGELHNACLIGNQIFMRHNDWGHKIHEKCHVFSLNSIHVRERKKPYSPINAAKVN